MNIQEATKKAVAEGKQITRVNSWWGGGENGIKIRPTDTDECCIISVAKKEAPRWNPQAEDLTADDWVVTE